MLCTRFLATVRPTHFITFEFYGENTNEMHLWQVWCIVSTFLIGLGLGVSMRWMGLVSTPYPWKPCQTGPPEWGITATFTPVMSQLFQPSAKRGFYINLVCDSPMPLSFGLSFQLGNVSNFHLDLWVLSQLSCPPSWTYICIKLQSFVISKTKSPVVLPASVPGQWGHFTCSYVYSHLVIFSPSTCKLLRKVVSSRHLL